MPTIDIWPWKKKKNKCEPTLISDAERLFEIEIKAWPANLDGRLFVESPANLNDARICGNSSVGAFTYFNHGVSATNVTIGRFCSIGNEVIINPGQHAVDFLTTHPFAVDPNDTAAKLSEFSSYRDLLGSGWMPRASNAGKDRVTIGHDVWIGGRATIMGGVTIGTGAIVGAGAVVTRDVEPYGIAVGIPARVHRERLPHEQYIKLLAIKWWNWNLAPLTSQIDYSDVSAAAEMIEQAIERGTIKGLTPRCYEIFRADGVLKIETTTPKKLSRMQD